MERASAQLTNTASELYVASMLSRLGYAVTITFGNTKVIDLMVAHPDGRMASIDVKGLKNTTNWPLSPKISSPTHFFALVSYRNRFRDLAFDPDVFIIPSTDIPKLLTKWPTLLASVIAQSETAFTKTRGICCLGRNHVRPRANKSLDASRGGVFHN